MSRKRSSPPARSNAEHRRRLRDVSIVTYGDYRWAIDNVPCAVCGAGRYLSCLPADLTYSTCRIHTARLLLSQLIPKGDSLFDKQREFVRHFSGPAKFHPKR